MEMSRGPGPHERDHADYGQGERSNEQDSSHDPSIRIVPCNNERHKHLFVDLSDYTQRHLAREMKDVMNRFLNGRQQTDLLAMSRRLMHHNLEQVQVRMPKWFLTPFSSF